jgi:hypothetical protein
LAISKEQRVSLMELKMNPYTAATGLLLVATIVTFALVLAGFIPAVHGLVVGNGLLVVAGVAFVTSRLERFASMAFRRGREVGIAEAARHLSQRQR